MAKVLGKQADQKGRRSILVKLAVTAAGAASGASASAAPAKAAPKKRPSFIGDKEIDPKKVATVFKNVPDGKYDVVLSRAKGKTIATVVVTKKGDKQVAADVMSASGATPITASVVDGIVYVDLGQTAEDRC
jgi:hypothetical protein